MCYKRTKVLHYFVSFIGLGSGLTLSILKISNDLGGPGRLRTPS